MSPTGSYEVSLRNLLRSLAQNTSTYDSFISILEEWEDVETGKLNQMAVAALLDEAKKPAALLQMGKVQAIQDALLFVKHSRLH